MSGMVFEAQMLERGADADFNRYRPLFIMFRSRYRGGEPTPFEELERTATVNW